MKFASVYPEIKFLCSLAAVNDDTYLTESQSATETVDQKSQVSEIQSLLDVYHRAMINVDTYSLGALLDPCFFLTHITEYKQPKYEWLELIRTGDFDYHRIAFNNGNPKISVKKNLWQALVTGTGKFDATINGMRNPWILSFAIKFEKKNNSWIIVSADYSVASSIAYF